MAICCDTKLLTSVYGVIFNDYAHSGFINNLCEKEDQIP